MFNRLGASRVNIGKGLKWVLIAQAILAVLLVAADSKALWRSRLGDTQTLPSGPVSPGDQVRRYDPAQLRPDFTDRTNLSNIELSSDLPDRLEFSMVDAGDVGQVLLMNGPIAEGDAKRFDAQLASMDEPPGIVALNSPGGNVLEALLIGRRLREAAAHTLMLPGMICLSSCPYILAAGTERRVSKQATIGLHQHYYETPGYMPVFLAVEGIQYNQGNTLEYLTQMGVDLGLMVYSLKTPPDEIYVLVEEELLQTRLATGVFD